MKTETEPVRYHHSYRPPPKLKRINGFEAASALILAMMRTRDGTWVQGAPSHIASELLNELALRGFYLGVGDQDA